MRKVLSAFLIVLALSFATTAFAADEKPTLDSANITIDAGDGKSYNVTEHIVIVNPQHAENGILLNTIAKKKGVAISNLKFTTNEASLDYKTTEQGDFLDKIALQVPSDAKDKWEYSVTYQVTVPKGQFFTPIVASMYPTPGDSNRIHIQFIAPKDNYIHDNSFPIVTSTDGNQVTSELTNMPSHVNYVFGTSQSTPFNIYNVSSIIIFILLIGLLRVWIKAERKNIKGVA